MIQHSGEVVIKMLENIKQLIIKPLIESTMVSGTLIFTDEDNIYVRVKEWSCQHKSVSHSSGEYVWDEDGGFHEVYVNKIEVFWSLLRSWLRPHRGSLQEEAPIYFGFFEFIHNIRKRGKAPLESLFKLMLA